MVTFTHRGLVLAATAITACAIAAGCSSSSTATHSAPSSASITGAASSAPATASHAAAATTITIKDFAYSVSGTAAGGSTVMVMNNDSEAHTVTADQGAAFDLTVQPGKTGFFVAPTESGMYKFHCNFHSTMHGTLEVGG